MENKVEFNTRTIGSDESPCSMIISDGHVLCVEKDGTINVEFWENPVGKLLKKMWEQLNKPIRRKK